MKKRTIYISLFLIFIIGVVSLIGTFAIDSTITEGTSSKADYLFNITLGDRTNRDILIPSYDSKIVDIKISNPNEFNMSYLLYLEGVNSNINIINISDTEVSGILNSKNTNLIKVFIQNNSSSDITTSIKDLVGFEKETLSLPSNSTAITKGTYYKSIVKSNNKDYGKVKPNIKLSTKNGTVKYNIVPNTGYKYKSTTCEGTVTNNILTIPNITSNISCEVVFEPKNVTVSLDVAGGAVETTYTEPKEYTYTTPYTGTYKLETWGAQGGAFKDETIGGYGGYSVGTINLNSQEIIYVNVGSTDLKKCVDMGSWSYCEGGYNGGGNSQDAHKEKWGSGGGATHIAKKSGLLSTLNNNKESIIMVAGGGGGAYSGLDGASGGGFQGNAGADREGTEFKKAYGGTQTAAGSGYKIGGFGFGGDCRQSDGINCSGGGAGLYGGAGAYGINGAGGSGYIGNSLLTNKYMYCYNCTTSDATDTKTYTTTNVSSTPTANYAKSGNGAARVTLKSNANYNVTYKDKYGTLPTPTRDGYTFGGWYTGENGTGTKVTSDTVLTNANNHTLHAKWNKMIKVSLDLAGGVVETTYTEPKEHTYTVPYNGTYKLETWGAAGGGTSSNSGGYGGYSVGTVTLQKNATLFANIGGQGQRNAGGYNGGGNGQNLAGTVTGAGYGGGGATHIATKSGLLKSLNSSLSSILIVSGGGGGNSEASNLGGSGGGTTGNSGSGKCHIPTGGTQSEIGEAGDTDCTAAGFGYGGNAPNGTTASGTYGAGGGGAGYYGGGAASYVGSSNCAAGGAGGSGYIGNPLLTNKYMYCYNCSASDATGTKTYTTTNVSSTPTANYAKSGNGAARITLVSTASYTKAYNEKYGTLPTPTRTGYTFDGWYTGENGTGTKIDENTAISNTSDHTLYAHWTVKVYIITFNKNGGTGGTDSTTIVF